MCYFFVTQSLRWSVYPKFPYMQKCNGNQPVQCCTSQINVTRFTIVFCSSYIKHGIHKCICGSHITSSLQMEPQQKVYINEVQIEEVQKCKYFGSLVQKKVVASTREIHNRIGQATVAFASLKWCLWEKNNITTKTKFCLFRILMKCLC